jgi:hypothetical protein
MTCTRSPCVQLRHPDSVLALAYIETEGHICAGK